MRRRAFFSFPLDGGLFAWQRRIRYRDGCELFLYTPDQVPRSFDGLAGVQADLHQVHRDLFVTADVSRS